MNTLGWIAILVIACAWAFFAGFQLCWRSFVLRRGRRQTALADTLEPEPRIEITYDIALVDRHARMTGGAQRIAIRHNTQPGAQN